MGSFNTTCSVSQQTIAPHDPCVVFPLSRTTTYRRVELRKNGDRYRDEWGTCSSTCYATSFWDLRGDFIDATYDDSGYVNINETHANVIGMLHLVSLLYDRGMVTLEGENDCHDLPFNLPEFVDKETIILKEHFSGRQRLSLDDTDDKALFDELTKCWGYIWEVAHEHRLFVLNWQSEPVPMQFGIIHKFAFDELINMSANQESWDGQSMDQRDFFKRVVERALVDTKEFFDGKSEEEHDPSLNPESIAKLKELIRVSVFQRNLRENLSGVGGDAMQYCEHVDGFYDLCCEILAAGEYTESQFEQYKQTLDARYAVDGMDALNLKFSPIVYASQDYSNEIGDMYAKFVAATSSKVTKSREEDE